MSARAERPLPRAVHAAEGEGGAVFRRAFVEAPVAAVLATPAGRFVEANRAVFS